MDTDDSDTTSQASATATTSADGLAQEPDGSTDQLDATAAVVDSRETNARVKFDRVLELELAVVVAGRPSYAVTIRQAVPQLHMAKVQPGARVLAKVHPASPSIVWLDLVNS
ncbi:MAG: hypothetical protein ACJ764_07675 [Solirubrobacteraceae bacterium]